MWMALRPVLHAEPPYFPAIERLKHIAAAHTVAIRTSRLLPQCSGVWSRQPLKFLWLKCHRDAPQKASLPSGRSALQSCALLGGRNAINAAFFSTDDTFSRFWSAAVAGTRWVNDEIRPHVSPRVQNSAKGVRCRSVLCSHDSQPTGGRTVYVLHSLRARVSRANPSSI